MTKNPGFTLIAACALALGIGANAAIFSVVNSVLLRPLHYPNSDRLMTIWEDHQARGGPKLEYTTPPGFEDWRDQAQSFEHVAALQDWRPTLTGLDEPEQLIGAAVSHNMFSLLAVPPIQGRTFRPEEDQRGANRVVIISHGLWQRRFGADPAIIGKTITLGGESHTVIGVAPADFKFPIIGNVEIWRTIRPLIGDGCQRGCLTIRVMARLKPGVTIEGARSELTTIARRIEREFPETNTKVGVSLISLHEYLVGDVKTPLLVLLCAVGFVLLIACANVANLMLARSATRDKEIAIRSALGAGRWRIVRQLMVESGILALIGGALGLLLAYYLINLLIAFSPDGTPRVDEITIDRRVLGFTFGISMLTGLLFGLVPAWQISKTDLNQSLKESNKSTQISRRGRRSLNALVIAETALALVLLAGAGLLMKSFLQLQRVSLGFNPKNVLTALVLLPRVNYPERQQITAFSTQLLDRIESLPGVLSAGSASSLPLSGFNTDSNFLIEGRPAPPPNQQPVAWYSSVSTDYFRTIGMQLRAGRWFNERDNMNSPLVVIISETMARRYFPNENPIGKRIGNGRPDRWREIIGVTADVKHFGLSQNARPAMFFPQLQEPVRRMYIVVRMEGDPSKAVPTLRGEVSAIDKNLAVSGVRVMEEIVAGSIAPERFTLLLLGIFAALALALAAAGIYGVMSYSVAQRTQEIGIRMALGAQTRDVLRLVVGHGMLLTLCGIAIGLAGSFALTRLMTTLLFGVSATDPITFVAVSLLLIVVALIACLLPARQAAKVDPMIALRYE
ncbi:MAG: ABC transporter permease [Acidobacteria bacterium]|nr:ABC transporter permease [Acidobacteriota bacterium]